MVGTETERANEREIRCKEAMDTKRREREREKDIQTKRHRIVNKKIGEEKVSESRVGKK
jgi:hypothetical protein